MFEELLVSPLLSYEIAMMKYYKRYCFVGHSVKIGRHKSKENVHTHTTQLHSPSPTRPPSSLTPHSSGHLLHSGVMVLLLLQPCQSIPLIPQPHRHHGRPRRGRLHWQPALLVTLIILPCPHPFRRTCLLLLHLVNHFQYSASRIKDQGFFVSS